MDRLWSLLFLAVPVIGIVIVVGAFTGAAGENLWLPESIGPRTEGIDYLFNLIHIILGVVFASTGLALAYCLFRFRADHQPRARYRTGIVWLEFVWTLVPALILLFLAFHQLPYWQTNKEKHPAFQLTGSDGAQAFPPLARVVAFQYGWRFVYPGRDQKFDTQDDIISENTLVLPVDQEVVLELVSEDVIHSFAINRLRLKQDIVPGLRPRVWFTITQPGDWEINCMELCGWGHFRMSARLRAVSSDAFNDWLNDRVAERGY